MKYSVGLLFPCAAILLACASPKSPAPDSLVWNINSLTTIGGAPTKALGNPRVVDTPYGAAVDFDGNGDRLLVDTNPVGDATEFTIEIIFNPEDAYPDNLEPRFFHIESPDNPNRRITIELRLNDKKQWYLDAYIKSEQSQFTLIDPTKVHPVGKWAHAAITYKNREFVSYVNGEKELIGQVLIVGGHIAHVRGEHPALSRRNQPKKFLRTNRQPDIGARMNQVHWFNGKILQVRISPRVLSTAEFLTLPNKE